MFQSQSRMFSPNPASSHTVETGREKGIVIEELSSDEEEQEDEGTGNEKHNIQNNSRSSKEPSVEHADDIADERKNKTLSSQTHNEPYKVKGTQPQNRSYNFQTCKVTYGGVDGAYYTSSRTRKAGGDGVVVEETKEADKTTGQATHKLSRGIHDKGHSVTRKLNSDGKVDMLQTLHNINEDELSGFEKMWNRNVEGRFPGRRDEFDRYNHAGSSSSEQKGGTSQGGWLLPSSIGAKPADNEARTSSTTGGGRTKKVVRINIE
ncbi:hypothetical protein FNV43_RR18526 [Rhamnella rubrinervis]|uniref:Myeloid leukemia factor n=1 Tax=Rhamnella rubrinervis TaxID=2594499 RepID=A0A8K0E3V8_9ROSA|nr:hypothetical protein FNV43_RR18526 [Rhamnella rubrinervis]